MTESLLRGLLAHRARRWIVIFATLAIGLIIGLPLADDYFAVRDRQAKLSSTIAHTEATLSRLDRFEAGVDQTRQALRQAESEVMSAQRAERFRRRVGELARASGCRIRRIGLGAPDARKWHQNDHPLVRNRTEKGPQTPFELRTMKFTLSASGPLSSIKELVGRLYAEQRLAHTRRFALHPAAGNRKEAILDLELVLFDLAEGGKEKNRRNG